MKTAELKKEIPFDVALADKRVDELKSKDSKLKSSLTYKTQQAIQKLLQIILHNVTISKGTEIGLYFNEETFLIEYIYNKEKGYSYNIKISFVKNSDVRFADDKEKEFFEKNNINVGDIKSVEFNGITIGFFKSKGESNEMHFEYISLQNYIATELTKGGEFISTLKLYLSEMRDIRNERETLWEEARELNSKKEKHLKNIYENEIRNANYFQEGNFIVVRKIKKDFIEASVTEIGKVQKTTFYGKHHSIEISDVWHTEPKKYAPKVESYRHEMKRHAIDTYISIWASRLVEGDRIEVLSTEEWNKLQKDMNKVHDDMKKNKLADLSERYRAIKYKRDEH